MMRSPWNGPRSLTRTMVERPLSRFVTRSQVGSGSVRCAAVRVCMSKRSPLEVLRPWNLRPYHDAIPRAS